MATLPSRSAIVTALGWIAILVCGLAAPISLIAGLMVLAGQGTQNANFLEGLLVIGGPPFTLLAGIFFLRRHRWAWVYFLLLSFAGLLYNLARVLRGPTPETTYIDANGVKTTVLASGIGMAVPFAVLFLVLLVFLLLPRVRREFFMAKPAAAMPPSLPARSTHRWRVGHQGRDGMYYEEEIGKQWRRIAIDGELLTGRAHHAVYLASPQRWREYPEWARDRRDEIVARIRSQFRPPDYDYGDDGDAPAPVATNPTPAIAPATATMVSPRQPMRTLWAIVIGFAIAAIALLAFAWHGIDTGVSTWPSKRASQQHEVSRQDDPAQYWMAIGVYSGLGLLFGFGSAWLARQGLREGRGPRAGHPG